MPDQSQARQKGAAGRDAYIAGRDLIVNDGKSVAELGMPGLLPRDVPGFTGRDDELARLASLASGGRVVVSAIGGTAGVGKTALAVHAAHQLLERFPDGHLYADLRGYTDGQDPAEPGEVIQVFLRRLGVPAEEVPAGVEERSGLLRQVLAGRRVLMVLDNARTEAQVRPLLPGTGGSLVLVTSRSVLPGLEADERINLNIMPEDEATTMLARVIGATRAEAEPQAVVEVARLCGRLPLALRIAGQLLTAHPAWPVGRLAGMLVGEQERLTRLGAGDLYVRTAFEVSYAQLAKQDARLFRLLGLHSGPTFDAASAAALAGTEPEAAGSVLERLAETHLVTEDATGRFSMHDLLRLYARATCRETDSPAVREAAEMRLVGYYARLAGFLNACVDPQQRPAAEQTGILLPSMREALESFQAERACMLAVISLAAMHGWDRQVIQLVKNIDTSLTLLRYLDDLLTVREVALAAARHMGNTGAEGAWLNNIGDVYRLQRRFEEAVDCFHPALALFREVGDRYGESTSLRNLGTTYAELRRFEEAIGFFQQALALFREDGDRYGEGMTLGNLGIAYKTLRRFEEAVGCYQQCLTIFREASDRRDEGLALGNLGTAYGELRRFEEAIDCTQQALVLLREVGDRYGEGTSLRNLGNAYAELRRFEEALGFYQQSLAVFQTTGDRYGEGLALGALGTAYQAMQQPGRAGECWREAAAAMRDVGDHEEARRLEQQAESTRSKPHHRWGLRRESSS